MYNPILTGTVVIQNIVNPKERILIVGAFAPMKYCIDNPTIKGRENTVIILTIAVYDIDKAVSPFAIFVSILEVTPPGQHASIIIPTAISLGKLIMSRIIKVVIGRNII
tara:strand:- start:472 stop:798 length:327 start_codon:yes stop_codon:yes gene_type:complete